MSEGIKIKYQDEELTYTALYEHSRLRGNIISWYPIESSQKVLLVTGGGDAVAEAILKKTKDLTVASQKEVKGLQEKGTYDVIVQIGILENQNESTKDTWNVQMKLYRTMLKATGRLLLAVPNRLGLKYFAGCQDEVYDRYFLGPEGYAPDMSKQACSRREYEQGIQEAGFQGISYYYPYPDYLFPTTIYSDDRLPEPGELNENIRNFNKDRYLLFDEGKVYNSLLKEGLYGELANSFFLVCDKEETVSQGEKVIYSKFSLERDERFQIRTDIIKKSDGTRVVRKAPMTEAAVAHLAQMEKNYHRLQENTKGTGIHFCPAKRVGEAVEFPWAKGEMLQHKLQRLLEAGDEKATQSLIMQYIEVVHRLFPTEVVDVDLIFPNILVDKNDWNIIDYEWTYEADIPEKWVLYRAMFYLAIQLPGYETTRLENLLRLAEISEEAAAQFENWEVEFQAYLTGNTTPIANMVDLLGNQVIPFVGVQQEEEKEAIRRMNRLEKEAKKLFFNMDRVEKKDGKAICCGWACAKTKAKEYIPVHITIFDAAGNPVGRAVERTSRPDVAKVLKAKSDVTLWGFSLSWSIRENQTFILRLNAGKCQQEILLEIGERN